MSYSYSSRDGLQLHIRERGHNLVVPAPFRPYFFVKSKYEKAVEYYAKRKNIPVWFEPTNLKTLDGQPVVKVEVEQPYHVSTLRDTMSFESYEADVPYVRRVMIDMDWKTSTSYSRLYYDIEVKDEKIVSIAFGTDNNHVEVLKGDERTILEQFLDIVSQYDMTLGYNSYNYDIPILKSRCKQYKLAFPDMQRWYDLLPALMSMSHRKLRSWSLEWVGKNLVGLERVHVDKPFSQLSMQEIYERCQRDVEIIIELDKKLNLSLVDIMKAHASYIFPDETVYITRSIDSLLLRKARQLGLVLPCKPIKPDVQQHSGAFVAQPSTPFKIYHDVLFLDCVSLYPSIIVNFKISPDADKRLYPEMVSELIRERKRFKQLYRETGDKMYDMLQYAYKILANAVYGAVNSIGFRIQRPDLGDEVARRGREIITSLMNFYRQRGFDVIYGDTDSVVLAGITADESVFNMLAEAGSQHIKNTFQSDIQVEAKKFYSKLYFTRRAGEGSAAKKKYAGLCIWTSDEGWLDTPTLDVVGIEIVRSDFPVAMQKLQQQLIEGYLNGKTIDELHEVLAQFKRALRDGIFDVEELAFSKSITQKNYKVSAPHIRAAKHLEKQGIRVNIGDKIRYVYTRFGALPVELCKNVPVDVKYYAKAFDAIAERTLGITSRTELDRWF